MSNDRGWQARFSLVLASATLLLDFGSRPARAERLTPAPGTSASPAATPAAGGKGAPANPAAPAGASPSPGARVAAPNDPCAGPGRLLATLNRPTVGYSACAVPKGSIVLEEGYQNQFQSGSTPFVAASYPQGFERFGVVDRFELDVIGPNFNRQRSGVNVTTGYNDLGLGFKYELPQKGRLTYGIDGLFTAPTGTGSFGSGAPTQTLDVDVAYPLSPAIGIGTTIAGASSTGFYTLANASGGGASGGPVIASAERYGYLLPSIVVTAQLPNAYQFYAEFVGQTKLGPEQGGRIFTDFGVQKLLGSYFELDAEYGIDFTRVAGSRFQYVGFGTGIRVK